MNFLHVTVTDVNELRDKHNDRLVSTMYTIDTPEVTDLTKSAIIIYEAIACMEASQFAYFNRLHNRHIKTTELTVHYNSLKQFNRTIMTSI